MQIVRRLFLFFLINLLIVCTLSGVMHLFGISPYLSGYGLDIRSLMLFCLIWGMGGALLSLALSRKMAEWLMRVQLVSDHPSHIALKTLTYTLAKKAGLKVMPQVGIYPSQEINAFATGPSKNRALVAVSQGLLDRMSPQELEGVLAHEISHITNGDMITMTLLQGIINAFVMFLSRILAYLLSSRSDRSSRRSSGLNYLSFRLFTYLFEVVFLLLGSLLICFFSRKREFKADRQGAHLAGTQTMIAALEALGNLSPSKNHPVEKAAFHSLKISTPTKKGLRALFASHPPLEERIAALKTKSNSWEEVTKRK